MAWPLIFVAREAHNKARALLKLDGLPIGELGSRTDGLLFALAKHIGFMSSPLMAT